MTPEIYTCIYNYIYICICTWIVCKCVLVFLMISPPWSSGNMSALVFLPGMEVAKTTVEGVVLDAWFRHDVIRVNDQWTDATLHGIEILLMEEILHHLTCMKPCKQRIFINWCRISSINSINMKQGLLFYVHLYGVWNITFQGLKWW